MARPTVLGSDLPALLPCCLAACCFGLLLCACTCIRSVCAINKSAVIKSVQPSSLKDSQFSQRPVYSPLPAQLTLCSPLSVLHARLNCHPEFAFRASPARLLSQTPYTPSYSPYASAYPFLLVASIGSYSPTGALFGRILLGTQLPAIDYVVFQEFASAKKAQQQGEGGGE